MTHKELVKTLAEKTGISTVETAQLLTSLVQIINDKAHQGCSVSLHGLGTFEEGTPDTLLFKSSTTIKVKINS